MPDAGQGRAQHDGELRALDDLVGQGALELLDGRYLAGQVALQLLVVAGDDLLDQLVVDAMLLVLQFGRHRLRVVLAVGLVLEGLIREQVGHAVERRLLADGQLEGSEARAERGPELVQHPVEVGPFLVLLVDEDHAGQPELDATAPDDLGLHLDAVDRAHHEDGQVGHAQSRLHLAHEVRVTGRVDEVDLVAFPLDGRDGQREGDPALDLLRLGVRDGRAVLHTADARGWRPTGPSSASTSVVFPLPLCPTRATLRMFAVGYVFTVEDPHLLGVRRPSARPAWLRGDGTGSLPRLRAASARVAWPPCSMVGSGHRLSEP